MSKVTVYIMVEVYGFITEDCHISIDKGEMEKKFKEVTEKDWHNYPEVMFCCSNIHCDFISLDMNSLIAPCPKCGNVVESKDFDEPQYMGDWTQTDIFERELII